MPKYFIYNLILCKNICFAAFLFIVGTTLYSNSSQKRVPEEAAAHVNARIFYKHRRSVRPRGGENGGRARQEERGGRGREGAAGERGGLRFLGGRSVEGGRLGVIGATPGLP